MIILSNSNHFSGIISLRQLIVKPGNTKLKSIMQTEVISVHTSTDQEEVARQVARYNILAIPVVTNDNKIVGVVSVDDTIDVLRDEATEDFLKMAGRYCSPDSNRCRIFPNNIPVVYCVE